MQLNEKTTVGDLRGLCHRRQFASIRDRMLAVIERRKGKSFRKIAASLDRSLDFVKTWNDRFKEEGARGLLDRKKKPQPLKLNEEQRLRFKERVLAGPKPEDGIAVFTTSYLSQVLLQEFDVSYGRRAVGKLLKRMGIVRLRPRPVHKKNSTAVMQEWQEKTFPLFFTGNKKSLSRFPGRNLVSR